MIQRHNVSVGCPLTLCQHTYPPVIRHDTWKIHHLYPVGPLIFLLKHLSMDWFKGKSTGRNRFSHWIWGFPVNFPLNQSIDSIFRGWSNIFTMIFRWFSHRLSWISRLAMACHACHVARGGASFEVIPRGLVHLFSSVPGRKVGEVQLQQVKHGETRVISNWLVQWIGLVGKIKTGNPHIEWENPKIDGFRCRFSRENQSIDWWYTYPSEKWWSSSVGMMKFPTEWKNNPNVPNHQSVI